MRWIYSRTWWLASAFHGSGSFGVKQGFTSNDLHFKVLLSNWTSAFGQDGVTESSGYLSSPDSTSGFHEMIQEAVTGSLEE